MPTAGNSIILGGKAWHHPEVAKLKAGGAGGGVTRGEAGKAGSDLLIKDLINHAANLTRT